MFDKLLEIVHYRSRTTTRRYLMGFFQDLTEGERFWIRGLNDEYADIFREKTDEVFDCELLGHFQHFWLGPQFADTLVELLNGALALSGFRLVPCVGVLVNTTQFGVDEEGVFTQPDPERWGSLEPDERVVAYIYVLTRVGDAEEEKESG